MIRSTLHRRHNERNGVSNHRRLDCLLNRSFRRRSKKTSKLRVTGFCEGNSPVTGEFPAQRASNAEIVSIWWRHHIGQFLCRTQQSICHDTNKATQCSALTVSQQGFQPRTCVRSGIKSIGSRQMRCTQYNRSGFSAVYPILQGFTWCF